MLDTVYTRTSLNAVLQEGRDPSNFSILHSITKSMLLLLLHTLVGSGGAIAFREGWNGSGSLSFASLFPLAALPLLGLALLPCPHYQNICSPVENAFLSDICKRKIQILMQCLLQLQRGPSSRALWQVRARYSEWKTAAVGTRCRPQRRPL